MKFCSELMDDLNSPRLLFLLWNMTDKEAEVGALSIALKDTSHWSEERWWKLGEVRIDY